MTDLNLNHLQYKGTYFDYWGHSQYIICWKKSLFLSVNEYLRGRSFCKKKFLRNLISLFTVSKSQILRNFISWISIFSAFLTLKTLISRNKFPGSSVDFHVSMNSISQITPKILQQFLLRRFLPLRCGVNLDFN